MLRLPFCANFYCIFILQQTLLLLSFCGQAVKQAQDLRRLQLDDMAREVVQAAFRRYMPERQALRAQCLGFQAGAFVHFAVAVFTVAHYRVPQLGQMRADLVGAPGDQADTA